MQRWQWCFSLILLALLIGILDWLTGYKLSFFVFYFIPISLAAWFLGRYGAFSIAVLCAGVWWGADKLTGHLYPSLFYAVWEPAIRLISNIVIGGAVSKLKDTLDMEKRTTGRLRAAIAERKKNEAALRELTATLEQRVAERTRTAESRASQLQSISMELIESEERERRRLSELLHDDLQQLLSAALLQLNADPAAHDLAYARQLLAESISTARNLSHELSPAVLHNSDLNTGLHWLARQMEEKFGLTVQLDVELKRHFDYSPIQVFLFRSARELLFNVVKHAGVKNAQLVLRSTGDGIVLTVKDRGRGFDPGIMDGSPQKAGLGLLSIRERARYIGGRLSVESASGRGSCFILEVPVKARPAKKDGA